MKLKSNDRPILHTRYKILAKKWYNPFFWSAVIITPLLMFFVVGFVEGFLEGCKEVKRLITDYKW